MYHIKWNHDVTYVYIKLDEISTGISFIKRDEKCLQEDSWQRILTPYFMKNPSPPLY